MRQVTLRGIPDDIETMAEEEARSKGISLNKAFLSLLRKGVEEQPRQPRRKKTRTGSEFRQFLGLWKKDEADAFDESLCEQRKIDEELWS